MTFVDTPRLLHGNTTVLTGTMETRRMWVVALLLVVLAATFHNFAGIAAAAVYAFMLGEIRNLSLRTGGLAGAFWIIALYAYPADRPVFRRAGPADGGSVAVFGHRFVRSHAPKVQGT